jgi:hypothetical protein
MINQRRKYFSFTIRILFCFSLFIIPVIYLLFSAEMVRFISVNSRDHILNWYSTHYPNALDKEIIGQICFTPQWQQWVTAHSSMLIILILLSLSGYILFAKKMWRFFNGLFNEIKKVIFFMIRTFAACSFKEKIFLLILFGCIIIYRIYFFISYPPLNDETYSYLYFAKPGIFIAATNYPTTNNHVFFNLVCAVINHLLFFTPMLVMRSPNMIGDLFLFFGIFCLFKRYGSFQRAFAVVAGTALCFMLSFYATNGRGYQWQEVCTLISLLGCWGWFFSPAWLQRSGYSLFIFTSVLGFYINPAFTYQFLALALMVLFMLIKKKDYKKAIIFIRSCLIILLMVLLLYLPLIIASSWHALVSNEFVSGGKDWAELIASYSYLQYGMNYIFNMSRAGIFIGSALIAFSLYLYFTHRLKGYFYDLSVIYFIATVASFIILILYKKVFPYERLFCSWILFLNIIFVNVCFDVIKKTFKKHSSLLISLFIFFKIALCVRLLYWNRYFIENQNGVKIYNKLREKL